MSIQGSADEACTGRSALSVDQGVETRLVIGPFDYGALSPENAAFLREQAVDIRGRIGLTTNAIVAIGCALIAVKKRLAHGQFLHWVQKECGFSIRTAQNFIRAANFAQDKYATVAFLQPATLYRISAKNAVPDVVNEVIARAEGGAIVPDADVVRMLKKSRLPKRQTANLSKGKREQVDEEASAQKQEKEKIAKANALDLVWRLGRENAAFLLGMREHIVETLVYLEREIDNPTPLPDLHPPKHSEPSPT